MNKIKAENIYKSFQGLEVLKGINLSVDEGEVVAVIGPAKRLRKQNRTGRLCTRRAMKAAVLPAKWAWCFSSLTCSRT